MKQASFIIGLFTIILLSYSCQKDVQSSDTTPTDTTTTPTASEEDLLKDSVFLYTKEVYFWHSVIPSYNAFNPRQYTGSDEEASGQAVLDAIKKLEPLDRYSFITTQAESDGLQTGNDEDYGFFIKAGALDKVAPYDSVHWFVEYVYKASPSGIAGVQRGWYISKINNSSINYDNASIDILNDVFFGNTSSATFTFTKPDGSSVDINLSKASFTANSVLYTNVITNGTHKVGYIVFNQFFGDVSKTELNTAFSDFTSKGITDVVIDLRYNRGGSTNTQDYFSDILAPSSANGKKMYTYEFNDSLQAGKFPLLKRKSGFSNVSFKPENNTVQFSKTGSLNLSRLFFIVSGSTASASELLINNLRPYSDVKLIGDTTYGKPVGFFPISIFNFAIYPISFRTINSVGTADYYHGFAPDKLAPDGINKKLG